MSFQSNSTEQKIPLEESPNDWSDSGEEFTPIPGLDPGKLHQSLRDKVESVLNKKYNQAESKSWKDWDNDSMWTQGNPFFNTAPPPPPPPSENKTEQNSNESESEAEFDLNKIFNMALPLFTELTKNVSNGSNVNSKSDYVDVVRSLEYTCMSTGHKSDQNMRAYCFAEKMYACCRQLLSCAKDCHGANSYVAAKAESVERQLQTEFNNLLEELSPESLEDEVD